MRVRAALLTVLVAFALSSESRAAPLKEVGYRHYKSGPIQVTADGGAVWTADYVRLRLAARLPEGELARRRGP